jgi:hypothetical protein
MAASAWLLGAHADTAARRTRPPSTAHRRCQRARALPRPRSTRARVTLARARAPKMQQGRGSRVRPQAAQGFARNEARRRTSVSHTVERSRIGHPRAKTAEPARIKPPWTRKHTASCHSWYKACAVKRVCGVCRQRKMRACVWGLRSRSGGSARLPIRISTVCNYFEGKQGELTAARECLRRRRAACSRCRGEKMGQLRGRERAQLAGGGGRPRAPSGERGSRVYAMPSGS